MSASPGPVERRRPGFVTGLVIGLLVMLVAVLAWSLATRGSENAQGSTSPSASTIPSPSDSTSPKQDKTPAVVKALFNKAHTWTKGENLSFAVFFLPYPDNDCNVHTYSLKGRPRGAFHSDCASWEPEYDVLLFHVGFENVSKHPVTLILRNLVLADRFGNTYAPVNVRSHAEYPPYFLNEHQQLPPSGRWSGWVTFDGRVVSLVPASLSYIDADQTLVQVFAGKPNVVQVSG